MERVICLAVGYVFGLFQSAYFYGKAHGIDIRQHGSGNAGTTNALRVLGTKAGLIVFAGDCLKCMAAVWITRLIFGGSHPDMIYLLCLYTGAGAILVICGQKGVFGAMSQAQLCEMYTLALVLAGMAYWKHRQNIVRLIHGNERRTYLFKKNKVDVEEEPKK